MPLDFLSPLHKASRQISVYLEGHTRELGVSPIEGHFLSYLRSYSPAPIGELVRVFGIKQSTFTSMLDRLEKAGLIRREMNPGDRRSFLIHITDPGRELAERRATCHSWHGFGAGEDGRGVLGSPPEGCTRHPEPRCRVKTFLATRNHSMSRRSVLRDTEPPNVA
jgi:DNA-binding MarR family transcriptional regulator